RVRHLENPPPAECRRLSDGGAPDALVDDRVVGHGHSGQCHHVLVHTGSGLRGRDAICAVLLWAADCHAADLLVFHSEVFPDARLHGVRVSGKTVQPAHATPRGHVVPDSARAGGGDHHLCALDYPVDHSRMDSQHHHSGHWRYRHPVHDLWVHGGGQCLTQVADDRHDGGRTDGPYHHDQ